MGSDGVHAGRSVYKEDGGAESVQRSNETRKAVVARYADDEKFSGRYGSYREGCDVREEDSIEERPRRTRYESSRSQQRLVSREIWACETDGLQRPFWTS